VFLKTPMVRRGRIFRSGIGHIMVHCQNRPWLKISLILAVIVCLWSGADRTAAAQEPIARSKVGFGVASTGPGGLYAFVPNRWGVMRVDVVNRLEKELEVLSATYFDAEPTLQFARKIWLPPRSKMQSWHPAKVPNAKREEKTTGFHSLVREAEDDNQVLIRADSGEMQHAGFLSLNHEPVTGVIENVEGGDQREAIDTVELVSTCRLKQSLGRKVTAVTDLIFVTADEGLQPLDQLVICDNRPMRDAAAIAAIRRWVNAGGRLWVFLDQVDPKLLNMVLGDDFQCDVVDRVSLNTVNILPGPAGPRGSHSETFFEKPVDLVRTIVTDVDVVFTVDGWPAAFWKNCSKGRVLVTTLGPRGWMLPRPDESKTEASGGRRDRQVATKSVPFDPERQPTGHIPNDPMGFLCMDLWAEQKVAPISVEAIEPIVQQYVGYAIPSRLLIVGLLAGFCGLLAVAGAALWRMGKMEWLGAIGPVLAIFVSLILVGIGQQQRYSIPRTTANMQFIQMIKGTDDYLAEGQLGMFNPEPGEAIIRGHNGGRILPEMAGTEGTTRRMIWTDLGNWQWHHLPATAGSTDASFSISNTLSERIRATATFGPDGLTGVVQSGGRRAEDVLIATNTGRIGVSMQADNTFTARTADVLSSGEFLTADLLTDEQNRRRYLLEHLLANPKRRDFPGTPTLYFWTDPWDLGFEFAADSKPLGAALVGVPLEFQRPAAGTEVSIAAPLLPFDSVIGPDNVLPTGMWDRLNRTWADRQSPGATWLRFRVPSVLVPSQTLKGRLVVSVTGPIGKLEIAAMRQGKLVTLKTWIDPVGTVEYEIDDPEALVMSESGGVLLRVSGGDASRPELTETKTSDGVKVNYWRIESLAFDLKVKTTEN
jgi:hypothetical protein